MLQILEFLPKDKINSYKFKKAEVFEAMKDIFIGTKNYHLSINMAMAEIRRRYKRTLLGPFWATLNLALYIGAMGFLFSYLWKMDVKTFLPYFSSGYICWGLLSNVIIDSCSTFIAADNLLKQIPLAYSTFSWLVVFRNILLFAHHAIFYVLIIIIMKVPINCNFMFFIPGLFLVAITSFLVSIVLGLVCARYRDLIQVVTSLLQILMFVTPIFWLPNQMGGVRFTFFVKLNPLYHYINIIRAPLLGNPLEVINWVITLSITTILAIIALYLFALYKRKLIFWL